MGKLKWALIVPVFPILLMVFFQNCTEPLEEGDGSSVGEEEEGALEPVAFDTVVDTLSYMSCEGMSSNYNKRAYFSFKVGAYSSRSGIRLTRQFLDSVNRHNLEAKVRRLKETENNLGTRLQMGIHRQDDYLSPLRFGSSSAKGRAYDREILGPLSDDVYASQIAELDGNSRVNYFKGLPDFDGKVIEGHLDMVNLLPGLQDSLRNLLEGVGSRPGLITLGYTKEGWGEGALIGPDQSPADQKAFGRGYRVSFGNGHRYDLGTTNIIDSYVAQGNNFNITKRTLQEIVEVDLNGGSSASEAQWICPQSEKFMIFRPQDVSQHSEEDMPCAVDRYGVQIPVQESTLSAEEAITYRVLLPEDWSIDFTRRCVVPKRNGDGCYGSENNDKNSIVNYYGHWENGRCGEDVIKDLDMNGDGRTEKVTILCPHYVSICFRQ